MNSMRSLWAVLVVGMTVMLHGCGSAAPEVAPELAQAQPGLNGGTAYPIPGDLGFVEVVVERTKPGKPVILAAYFLDSTAKSAMTTEPATVKARLVIPLEDAPKDVTLSAKAKPGSGTGKRFATEPGNFDFDELRGDLFVTLEGKELTVPFAFR